MTMAEDKDFEALLTRASTPSPPPGALDRLLAKAAPAAGATVVPFRKPERRSPWGVAALLAASLAAGLYLGANGLTDSFDTDIAGLDDPVDLSGVSEAEDTLDEEAT
jgi:hypothetical protein